MTTELAASQFKPRVPSRCTLTRNISRSIPPIFPIRLTASAALVALASLANGIGTARADAQTVYRGWIEQMRLDPRGPFDSVKWFRKDGDPRAVESGQARPVQITLLPGASRRERCAARAVSAGDSPKAAR
jgi:hypothetical protein